MKDARALPAGTQIQPLSLGPHTLLTATLGWGQRFFLFLHPHHPRLNAMPPNVPKGIEFRQAEITLGSRENAKSGGSAMGHVRQTLDSVQIYNSRGRKDVG